MRGMLLSHTLNCDAKKKEDRANNNKKHSVHRGTQPRGTNVKKFPFHFGWAKISENIILIYVLRQKLKSYALFSRRK